MNCETIDSPVEFESYASRRVDCGLNLDMLFQCGVDTRIPTIKYEVHNLLACTILTRLLKAT